MLPATRKSSFLLIGWFHVVSNGYVVDEFSANSSSLLSVSHSYRSVARSVLIRLDAVSMSEPVYKYV